jgi:hypothetical protein
MRTLTTIAALAAFVVPLAASADDWKDESGKGRGYREGPSRYYGDNWGGGRGNRGDKDYRGGSYGYAPPIPDGHLPPPGECRVWYPDRPAGHQPPPFKC